VGAGIIVGWLIELVCPWSGDARAAWLVASAAWLAASAMSGATVVLSVARLEAPWKPAELEVVVRRRSVSAALK
jgi:hypothetical protein